MERREPEKKEMHRLNQVAIRMVEMPPLFSEEPMNCLLYTSDAADE